MIKIKNTCISITSKDEYISLIVLFKQYNFDVYQRYYDEEFTNCYFDTVLNCYFFTPYGTPHKTKVTFEELENIFIKKGKNITKTALRSGSTFIGGLPTNKELWLVYIEGYYIIKGYQGGKYIERFYTTFRQAKQRFLK